MNYLISLFSCGAMGIPAKPPEKEVSWEKIIKLSKEQSIPFITAMAIKKSDVGCPAEIKAAVLRSLTVAAVKNKIRTGRILNLISEMESAGIPCVLLKGIDSARYYADPECRVSADTDILIAPEKEDTAVAFLKKSGFSFDEKDEDMHHSVAHHPQLGMLELHTKLWEEVCDRDMFADFSFGSESGNKTVSAEISEGRYYSLDYTDNLIFLTLHMIKHFIYSGASLRMIMDTALFMKENKDEIDKERYVSVMEKLGYIETLKALLSVMIKYGELETEDLIIKTDVDSEITDMITDDLEIGGWQGRKEKNRTDGWYYIMNTKEYTSASGRAKLRKKRIAKYFFAVFPSMEFMRGKYPVLNKHRYLYPLMLIYRIITRGLGFLFKKHTKNRAEINREDELSPEALKRVEIFRRLGIINF